MADPTIQQAWQAQSGAVDGDGYYLSAEVPYLVFDASTEAIAAAAVVEQAPAQYENLNRDTPFVEIQERRGDDIWLVVAKYRGADSSFSGTLGGDDRTLTFDTTGGTTHITQSITTPHRYDSTGVDGSAPNLKRAVNWDGETVNGLDIGKGVYRFTETHTIANAVCNHAYRADIAGLTYTVNTEVFRDFEAGEVLFTGANGARRGSSASDDWEITFSFEVNRNQTVNIIEDKSVTVKGWEYMWIQYSKEVDGTTSRLIAKPLYVYIEQVYRYGDFDLLRIGN